MSPLSAFSDTFTFRKKTSPIEDNSNQTNSALEDTSLAANQTATTDIKMVETNKKPFTEQTDTEALADLANQEISLDLQGLIDDSQFADDNLFGDLMETAKKNDAAAAAVAHHHHHHHWMNGHTTNPAAAGTGNNNNSVSANNNGMLPRGPTPSSGGGSSGQNSPVGGSDGHGSPVQQTNPGYGVSAGGGQYGRNTLAYLPGSVHAAGFNQINQHNQNVQV